MSKWQCDKCKTVVTDERIIYLAHPENPPQTFAEHINRCSTESFRKVEGT